MLDSTYVVGGLTEYTTYFYNESKNGSGPGEIFSNTISFSNNPTLSYSSISPFTVSTVATDEYRVAQSEVNGEWIFKCNTNSLILNTLGNVKLWQASGSGNTALSWAISDITVPQIIGNVESSWGGTGTGHSVNESFTSSYTFSNLNTDHEYMLSLRSWSKGLEDGGVSLSSLSVTFATANVPECSTFYLLLLSMTVVFLVAYYNRVLKKNI